MASLGEELVLLAYCREKGTIGRSSTTKETLTYALTAGIIMELLLAGRIDVKPPAKKFFTLRQPHGSITVTDPAPTGDDILDDALSRIRSRGKVKGAYYWIDKLGPVTVSSEHPLIDWSGKGSRFVARLADQGVMFKQEHKTLGLVSSPRFRLMEPGARKSLEERLDSILFGGETPDRREAMLAALVRECRLLDDIYPERERFKRARQRAEEIRKSDSMVEFLTGELRKVHAAHDAVTVT